MKGIAVERCKETLENMNKKIDGLSTEYLTHFRTKNLVFYLWDSENQLSSQLLAENHSGMCTKFSFPL